MAHYKTIDGIKFEQELLNKAEALTAGAGDGRISFDDAKALMESEWMADALPAPSGARFITSLSTTK